MAQTIEELSEDIESIKTALEAIQRVVESQQKVNQVYSERIDIVGDAGQNNTEVIRTLLTNTRQLAEHVHNMQIDIQEIKEKLSI